LENLSAASHRKIANHGRRVNARDAAVAASITVAEVETGGRTRVVSRWQSEPTIVCAHPACALHTRRTIPSRSNTGWRRSGMDGRAPRCAIHQCPIATPAQVENSRLEFAQRADDRALFVLQYLMPTCGVSYNKAHILRIPVRLLAQISRTLLIACAAVNPISLLVRKLFPG
jgi:hypothetical protein